MKLILKNALKFAKLLYCDLNKNKFWTTYENIRTGMFSGFRFPNFRF